MLTFPEVLQWMLEQATLPEQLALHAVLKVNVVDPAHVKAELVRMPYERLIEPPKDYPPVKLAGPLPGMTTEMQVLDRHGNPIAPNEVKPGQYTARVTRVSGRPKAAPRLRSPEHYKPESAFGQKWWAILQLSGTPLSPQALARAAGKPALAKQVSSTLGALFKRRLVTRAKQDNYYVYSVRT